MTSAVSDTTGPPSSSVGFTYVLKDGEYVLDQRGSAGTLNADQRPVLDRLRSRCRG